MLDLRGKKGTQRAEKGKVVRDILLEKGVREACDGGDNRWVDGIGFLKRKKGVNAGMMMEGGKNWDLCR